MSIIFAYTGVDMKGSGLAGEISATSEKDALLQLSNQSITVLSIQALESKNEPSKVRKVTAQDVQIALYELATMLNAGVSAAEAVGSQAKSSGHSGIRRAFHQAEKTLRHGGTFEQAMLSSGLSCPKYVIFLIRAGEMTGSLGAAILDASEQMQFDLQIRSEVKSALIYPAILVTSGVLAVLLMFVYVVPNFTNLLQDSDSLPALAWFVLTLGKWASENFLLFVFFLASLPLLVVAGFMNPASRVYMLERVETFPLVGEWISNADVSSWAKVLASLVANKVELISALDLASESVRMPIRKKNMTAVKNMVKQGEALSVALQEKKCLTDTAYNLIRVGERSGSLDTMLSALANLYIEQGRQRMKSVLSLIEPVAILVIGALMGVIIIGIMLAITSVNDIPM
ncbi:MAG: type II secretion system F family protein [Cellvibrionaceae bacterium]